MISHTKELEYMIGVTKIPSFKFLEKWSNSLIMEKLSYNVIVEMN
jgi:maltose-binding protein MalE